MLALEFDRMERLLERILDRLESTTERLSNVQKLVLGVLAVVAAAGWVAAIVLWEIPVLPG
jgi:flagellar biosynthesis/type III secretory pathway M-ring protein FliF/YscJ